MRLSLQTDYALRTLMFLAVNEGHHSIADISTSYGISKNHLMKVAQRLVAEGFVTSVRGRSGGLKLARPANQINVGTVVRAMEDVGGFVDCSEPSGKGCIVSPACGLRHVLARSVEAFMEHLDLYVVDDLTADPAAFNSALIEI